MAKTKVQEYSVNIQIKAVVEYRVNAESLEQAIQKGRDVKFADFGIDDVMDGNLFVVGVNGNWDVD